MEGYPPHYVAHNLPFVVLFGLGSPESHEPNVIEKEYPLLEEKGIYVSSDIPNVSGPSAEELLRCFHDFDAKDASWNNRPGKGKMGTMGFTYRSVGRAFTLPPHKAKSPSSTPSPSGNEVLRRPSLTPVLHSPLSPLTPDSPVFPNGIMTSLWFSKHQLFLPSALIAFFNFTLDPNSSTLQDNKLKSEINRLRMAITSSSNKFRLVVVLVCEDDDSGVNPNDRITNIRRATSSDTKSLYFLPSRLSSVEIKAFVGTVLASLQPTCIEYYRDLTKHARRKKNRGTIPPPTAPPTSGTSQILTAQGWAIRYEIKLGFFAEFRQEMDAAGRNYESAYESLLDGDVFESISNWSPRFDEARLLADVIALRIIRCLLWTGQTTSAVQSWSNHRARIQDLIDRKGKGSGTYGWEAWEARWSTVMGELIEKVDVPIFHIPEQPGTPRSPSVDTPDLYAIPEKAFASEERLPPWDLLHHEGYWFRRAAQHTRARRKLALAIPKEDRYPAGHSPASQIANKSHLYDTYLCPEPHIENPLPGHKGFDHGALLVDSLYRATGHFSKRQQSRCVERLEFEIAREYMRSGRWEDAMALLKPLWQKLSWRRAGWWKLVEEASWAVRACARHLGDGETLVAVEWELLSNCAYKIQYTCLVYPYLADCFCSFSALTPRSNWQYDISKCLDGLDIEERPSTIIESDNVAPCCKYSGFSLFTKAFAHVLIDLEVSAFLVFGAFGGRVGEPIETQLTITSQTHETSAPVTLSYITIDFEGGLKGFTILHDPNEKASSSASNNTAHLHNVSLEEFSSPVQMASPRLSASKTSQILSGSADLLFSPGASKIFNLFLLPREAGEVRAVRANVGVKEESFDLNLTILLREQASRKSWWAKNNVGLLRKQFDAEHALSIEILPKPPKLQIEILSTQKAYYTNEVVDVPIAFTNEEEDDAEIRLDIQLTGSSGKAPALRWTNEGNEGNSKDHQPIFDAPSAQLVDDPLGQIPSFVTITKNLNFQALPEAAEYMLEITANYRLSSDPNTLISKTVTKAIVLTRPFEVNYEFVPQVHPEKWPSYFQFSDTHEDADTATKSPKSDGLKQIWTIGMKLVSFAVEPLLVRSAMLKPLELLYGATCKVLLKQDQPESAIGLNSNGVLDRSFDIELQKLSLEDRRASLMSSQLDIEWCRDSSPVTWTTASLPVPQLTIPFGEPRVLASSEHSTSTPFLIHLCYTLENPSVHLLTFSLSMEASEEFAFSGPKTTTVQLVPLSRRTVNYNILSAVRGAYIRPSLRVVDVGFGKILKIGPAKGCKGDKKGLMIWVDAE